MPQSGLTVGKVGKAAGGFLSLGTEKQREIISVHACTSACVCTFSGGKGNPGEKDSQKMTRL